MWWQLLILQVFFFILLMWALKRLFHGHVLAAIARVDKLQKQNEAREEAIRRAEQISTTAIEDARRALNEETARRRAKAEEEAEEIRNSARALVDNERCLLEDAARRKEQALERRFEEEAAERAARKAAETIRAAFSPAMLEGLHASLTGDLLESLGTLEARSLRGDGPVAVRTAFPLTAAQKESLKSRLSRLLDGASPSLKEEVDSSLLAGFSLAIGQRVLDGTLKNRLERAARS